MDKGEIIDFLKEVVGPSVKTKVEGQWVMSPCPLAPWTHSSGKDEHASFGVRINPDGASMHNCFTCKTKGPLQRMLRSLAKYTGDDFTSLIAQLDHNDFLGADLPDWQGTKRRRSKMQLEPLDAETFLDLYEPAEGHPYLRKRGLTDQTAKDLQLRIDPDNHGVERLLFPVYGFDGKLYGFSGRAIAPKDAVPKIRDYHGLRKEALLLGADLLTKEDPYVLLVEGLLDWAKVYQHGYPVVAAMHSGLTSYQASLLRKWGKPVYVFYDRDKAGLEGRGIVSEALSSFVPVMKVRYPKRYVGKGKHRHRVSDPGELRRKEVGKMVRTALLM